MKTKRPHERGRARIGSVDRACLEGRLGVVGVEAVCGFSPWVSVAWGMPPNTIAKE